MKPHRLYLAGFLACALAGCAASPPVAPPMMPRSSPAPLNPDTDPASPLSAAQRESRAASRWLLAAERYADLDARMNGFQQAYRDGTLTDLGVVRELAAFAWPEAPAPVLENLDAWVRSYPDSYAAHVARGIHQFRLGTKARGTLYIDRTPPANIEAMEAHLAKAQGDFETSLRLDARPIASYRYLIVIAMELGQKQRARELADAALKMDSDSIVIRRPYMTSLETRWGGSLDEMLAFRAESAAAGVSADHLRMLDELIARERRWIARGSVHGDGADPAE